MGNVTQFRRSKEPLSAPELCKRVGDGDPFAKEELFRRHFRMVRGLSFRLLGARGDIEDLVQDVFVEAFANLHKIREPEHLGSWLGGITVHLARRRLERERFRARFLFQRSDTGCADDSWAKSAPPDAVVELREVYSALGELPVGHRLALVLSRVEGYSLDEVAKSLEVSLATTKRWIQRAESRLTEAGVQL